MNVKVFMSTSTWEPKNLFVIFIKKEYAYLSVSIIMFCEKKLAHTVHIDWCYHTIHKH